MKKTYRLCAVFCLLLCLAGCDTYEMFNYYPEYRSTVWYCEEIDFEIEFIPNEYGNLAPQASPLEWNGTTYEVKAGFFAGYFDIYLNKNGEATTEDSHLLSGRWQYENGNVVVEITKDSIFNNTFEELVFKPEARNAE